MSTRVGPSTTLLIKMTPGSRSEAAALAAGGGRVVVIRDGAHQDQISLGGRCLDLRTSADGAKLGASLGLDEGRGRALGALLERASPGSRDELGQLARLLARAETGKVRLERLVLSGHFDPAGVRGELDGAARNGSLEFVHLRRLLELFPGAAGQVRHLMLATCFRGGTPNPAALEVGQGVLQSYRELFPGLRTVTGYLGRAHRSGQGAEADLRRWARATRQPGAPLRREQVFGRCPVAPSLSGAVRRRADAVVHGSEGEQRCR